MQARAAKALFYVIMYKVYCLQFQRKLEIIVYHDRKTPERGNTLREIDQGAEGFECKNLRTGIDQFE